MFVVRIRGYAYLVPFVETKQEVFLKTIISSRKATRIYLDEERLRPPGGHKSKNNLSAPHRKKEHDIEAQAGAKAEHTLVLLCPLRSVAWGWRPNH